MIYFFVSIVSVLMTYYIEKSNFKKTQFLIFFLPIMAVWIIILGFQDGVGTDYEAYIRIFESQKELRLYYHKSEYLFYHLVLLLRKISSNSQILFIVVSTIQVVLTSIIFKKLKEYGYSLWLIVFLYVVYSGIFFNQMNILRQYIALPFLVFSVFSIIEKKYIRYLIYIIIGSLFHRSILLMLPLVLFRSLLLKKYKRSTYILVIIFLLGLSVVGMSNIMIFVIGRIVPTYAAYLESSYAEASGFKLQVVKYLYLPIFFYSLVAVKHIKSQCNILLFNLGFISYGLFFILADMEILLRIYNYLSFFTIFPIYHLMKHLIGKKKYIDLGIVFCVFVGLFVMKVVYFPSKEYLYDSIMFSIDFFL